MTFRVCIIGAGISGLATAYELRRRWRLAGEARDALAITVLERQDQVGGNAQTRTFELGDEFEYRFCDLGVNDFNARTYTNVVRVFNELQIPYSLLEDSACFYDVDRDANPYVNDTTYTLGGAPYYGMSLPMQVEFARFRNEAAQFLNKDPEQAYQISILDYLQQPPGSQPYSAHFINRCILPRVNAMYFCTDREPCGTMPMGVVMHYYTLQEGFGTRRGPLRMYFPDGAQRWLERLADATGADVRLGAIGADVRQVPGTLASGDGPPVWQVEYFTTIGGPTTTLQFDRVVFALPPAAMIAITPDAPASTIVTGQLMTANLNWASATAVAHVYSDLLPRDQNFWRTYNIAIRDHTTPQPYSMTYVENRHQNDAKNADFNQFGLPQFFVTLNPLVRIPDEYVLTDSVSGEPIQWELPHLIVDQAVLAMQQQLPARQGLDGAYFVGNWCYYTGLHEECWIHAGQIAQQIVQERGALPASERATIFATTTDGAAGAAAGVATAALASAYAPPAAVRAPLVAPAHFTAALRGR